MHPALQRGTRDDLAEFNMWLDRVRDSHILKNKPNRFWFAQVIEMLLEHGFAVQEDERTIMDGGPLTFMRDHARVIVSKEVALPVNGSMPGIELSDEMESWECVLSVRTPIEVVRAAISKLEAE